MYDEIPEDPELHRRWNSLALQTERPEVFYTIEWALAVQSAYKNTIRPLLLVGYKSDELVGVAPLALDAAGAVSFLAANTADYCEFLSLPKDRAEFIGAVFGELRKRKVNFLTLANVPEESATLVALRSAGHANGFHIFARTAYLCAQVVLGSGEQRRALKLALVGKKKLRRYLREMEREGPVTFAHLQSFREIEAALPQFADAHVTRFRATHRVSSLTTPERRIFLEELARRFADTGTVTLSLLLIASQPIAWNYGFQFCGSWFWYQPTFDSRHELNSPGHCLLSQIIMEACDMESMAVVDLGLGAEGYKERFANGNRQTLHVIAARSLSRYLYEGMRYRFAGRLKRWPKIESVARRILGK